MKTIVRYLTSVCGLALAWPAARAADETRPAPKPEKRELRVLAAADQNAPRAGRGAVIRHLAGAGEKEVVTFLGVETSPVSPTLSAQLGLTEGTGLVVNQVVPDSPAAGALKVHDILLKLDDQILIEQRQLSVLVRSHKEGDEVTLTYLRSGKQATAKVKLARHEVPKMSFLLPQPGAGYNVFTPGTGLGDHKFDLQILPGEAPRTSADIDRLLGLMDRGLVGTGLQHLNVRRPAGPGNRSISVTVNTGNSDVTFDDDQGTLELSIRDGKKKLVAKDAGGREIFSGPVNTPEERKALSAEVRARLEKLEDSTQFRFKTDADFKGAETRIVHPRGQSIAVPPQPPPPAPRRATLFF